VIAFGLLGPLEARRDGAEVALGGRMQRAVLALLLLDAGRVVSIDRIADELYAGDTPATAMTQVHRQISDLRRALGERAIETRAPGYVVHVGPDGLDGEHVGHDGPALAGDGAVVHGPPDVAGDLDGVHGGAQVLGERALDGTLETRLEAVEQTHQRTSSVWAQVGSGLARLSAGAGRFLNGAARTVDG